MRKQYENERREFKLLQDAKDYTLDDLSFRRTKSIEQLASWKQILRDVTDGVKMLMDKLSDCDWVFKWHLDFKFDEKVLLYLQIRKQVIKLHKRQYRIKAVKSLNVGSELDKNNVVYILNRVGDKIIEILTFVEIAANSKEVDNLIFGV